jgi:hypothetical protein
MTAGRITAPGPLRPGPLRPGQKRPVRTLAIWSGIGLGLLCLAILASLAFKGPPRWLVLALIAAAAIRSAVALVEGAVWLRRRLAAR